MDVPHVRRDPDAEHVSGTATRRRISGPRCTRRGNRRDRYQAVKRRPSQSSKKGQDEGARFLNLMGRAGINLVIYPDLFVRGTALSRSLNLLPSIAPTCAITRRCSTMLPRDQRAARPFDEDIPNCIAGRLCHHGAGAESHGDYPGDGMARPQPRLGPADRAYDGSITSNKTDDTANRGGYFFWRELMNRDVKLAAV